MPIAPALPSTTSAPSLPDLQDPTPTPHATPPQDQPLTPYDSLPQDQLTLEILQLKKRVKKLEMKKKSKSLGLKRLRMVGRAQRVESFIDTVLGAQEDASKQGGKIAAIIADEDVNVASKGVSDVSALELVSAVEPMVFNDEDVIMTMAQTLIKLKAKKAKLPNKQIAQKLHDEEVQKAIARDKQERADMERAIEFQR
nr:hypothetical protein [Tanacetum cinerariifolium]